MKIITNQKYSEWFTPRRRAHYKSRRSLLT